MGVISVGFLNEKDGGYIGDITLSKGKCSMCSKEEQIILEIDFCCISDEEGTQYENVCLGCLNFWGNTLHLFS